MLIRGRGILRSINIHLKICHSVTIQNCTSLTLTIMIIPTKHHTGDFMHEQPSWWVWHHIFCRYSNRLVKQC